MRNYWTCNIDLCGVTSRLQIQILIDIWTCRRHTGSLAKQTIAYKADILLISSLLDVFPKKCKIKTVITYSN